MDDRFVAISSKLIGFDALSPAVKGQLAALADLWRAHLGGDLIGLYLHGSLALGAFCEGVSDIDVLAVTARRLERTERLAIAADMLAIDDSPSPLELSALWTEQLRPWQHPTPCQFHYSSAWTGRYREMLARAPAQHPLLDEDFTDRDIACHVALTRQSGICLYGAPIPDVFPEIPIADFWDSIAADVPDYDFHAYEPRFFPANVLGLGRVLSFAATGRILSKFDAGRWMLDALPEHLRPPIEGALRGWYLGERYDPPRQALDELRAHLQREIKGARL